MLDHAESLADEDPSAARAVWAGIVELYAERPWLSNLVDEARAGLEELDSEGSRGEALPRESG